MSRRFLVFVLLLGCVRGQYTRTTINEPLEDEALASLTPGVGLQACLDKLGAPLRVWETDADGFALAYGWLRDRGWSASVSYSFLEFGPSASISYDDQAKKLRGAVLFFRYDMKLVKVRKGLLSDLLPPRRRPVDPELLR